MISFSKNNLGYFVLSLIFFSSVKAEKLNEAAIYYRCHSQFVEERPKLNDPYIKLIKDKKIKADEACMKLIEESSFDALKKIKSLEYDDRQFKLLRVFQKFHMSWFPNKDLLKQETENPTSNIYDVNEMGYHLTYNLFEKKSQFREIVTRKYSFKAKRFSHQKDTYIFDPNSGGGYQLKNSKKWKVRVDVDKLKDWNPEMVEFGKLIDIIPMSQKQNQVHFYFPYANVKTDFSINANYGAGILGIPTYILLNTSQQSDSASDGGMKMHRSWVKSVFSDLLCRQLPVLRKEDIVDYTIKTGHLKFRKDEGCVLCHATMDPFAAVVRNVADVRLGGAVDDFFSPRAAATFKQTSNKEVELSESSDLYYFTRPTKGRLYFRNYKGDLINKNLNNIQELGEEIANQDDLYICVAKRYFEFMTGVNVIIGDFTTKDFEKSPKEMLPYRNFVIKLGLELKKDQSLKKMIHNILKSSFYSESDYGVTQ